MPHEGRVWASRAQYCTSYIQKYLGKWSNISLYLATAPGPTLPAVTHGHSELRYERS